MLREDLGKRRIPLNDDQRRRLAGTSAICRSGSGALFRRFYRPIGTVLMRLIEMFGLPNAPEYHDWSDEFMDLKREGCFWEYIFQVNEHQYFFVSHDNERVTVGCKTTPDERICGAFFRFLASELNRSPIPRNAR